MLSLESPLTTISGIGPSFAKKLGNLDLFTVRDILFHFPSRYEDFSKLIPIKSLKIGEQVTIKGKIQLIKSRRAFHKRLNITEALVADATGTIKAIWFNQPYLAQTLKQGSEILLAGKLTSSNYGLQIEHPVWEMIERGGIHTNRLVPFYPLSGNITHRFIRNAITRILPLANKLSDWLPAEVRIKCHLPPLAKTIYNLHSPNNLAELELARRRIVFDELYLANLRSKLASINLKSNAAPIIPFSPTTKQFVESLPWQLTTDQKLTAWKIIQDLGKSQPMFRLLQGDVGSGKTIVAGLAALNAVMAGWQTAFLAPTEILAKQHWETLSQLFINWPITIGLLTRGHHLVSNDSSATSTTIKKLISNNKINILIGTHAILEKSVKFNKLGLVVVDEQHRFGVEQRNQLINKKSISPHFLSLSATPIPRSLALTIYGDLDISIIHSLPTGRKPITTTIVPPTGRERAYALMRHEVTAGNRIFVVCPLIDESDTLGVKAATNERERLAREVFPDIKIGLLHGKLSSKEKNYAMENFRNGATPILVSTSVVEVGVDVPQATIMAMKN